jgi:hypothetical protein
MWIREKEPVSEAGADTGFEMEDDMRQGTHGDTRRIAESGYFRAGWTLLVIAVLAIAVPILATAAQPHVVWLFSTSYGAVGMVLGVTLIRIGHGGLANERCPGRGLVECRS